ncbi:MAG: hypothetical protein U5L11_03570 [Arhodomonas sp.]|nr:hypothetical protein [Arhodomonas sp.]
MQDGTDSGRRWEREYKLEVWPQRLPGEELVTLLEDFAAFRRPWRGPCFQRDAPGGAVQSPGVVGPCAQPAPARAGVTGLVVLRCSPTCRFIRYTITPRKALGP